MAISEQKKESVQKEIQDFDQMIGTYGAALEEFYKGNPKPFSKLYEDREDISLLGAFGGVSVREGGQEAFEHPLCILPGRSQCYH